MLKRLTMAAMTLLGAASVTAQAPDAGERAVPRDQPVDYARDANWLCRPGLASSACAVPLDAMAIDAAGHRTPDAYVPAAAPPIDCFYVYPTVSEDPGAFSDLVPGPEERTVVVGQAARFASVCRLFAPVYRQFTMSALRATARGATLPASELNYDDVLAAWRWYLRHENRGRGVVLIGHSQGAMLLKQLIAREIDGKPDQRLLVSALLAGNPALTVAPGSDRGGSFRSIPLCRAEGQTGCVVAWQSYAEDDMSARRFFGGDDLAGNVGACTNPAALAGGRGLLKSYMRKPSFAPAGDPPYVEAVGQLSAECVADGAGAVLRVRAEPGPMAPLIEGYLKIATGAPGWGYHSRDINLVQGNLIDIVRAQSAAWVAR